MRPGVVGSILRTKCDEWHVRHLRHVHRFWASLLDHDRAAMAKLDHYTVETVQLRSPAHSLSDQRFLRPLLQKGDIFALFDSEQRERIWRGLVGFPGLVPSLHTFFQNFKYWEHVVDCVKKLIRPAARQTVGQALDEAFSETAMAIDDPNFEHSKFDGLATDRSHTLDLASRKLFLYAMRNLEELRPGSILVGPKQPKTVGERSVHAWHSFATHAAALGFESPGITDQLLDNPDYTAARHSLWRARDPSKFQYDEARFGSYVEEIAAVYTKAWQIKKRQPSFALLSSDVGEEVTQRCGCPHKPAYRECVGNLYLEGVHQDDPDAVAELTPLYVRRDIYRAYFGGFENPDSVDPVHHPSPEAPQLLEALAIIRHRDSHRRRGSSSTMRGSSTASPHQVNTSTLSGVAYTASVYSQVGASELSETDRRDEWTVHGQSPTPARGQTFSISPTRDGESAMVQFVRFHNGEFHVEDEVYVVGNDDPAVERVASRYLDRGLMLLTTQWRCLAASQCRQVAIESHRGRIVLMPQDAVYQDTIRSMEEKHKNLKRSASDELVGDARRQKFHVT